MYTIREVTGYIKRDIEKSSDVDFEKLNIAYNELQELSDKNKMCIIVGTIMKKELYGDGINIIKNRV